HLRELRQGRGVTDPLSLRTIPARRYIVFETHFGRAHQSTGQHIDLLVWIDTPPDVALARNLKDLLKPMLQGGRVDISHARIAAVDAYLDNYLAHVRRLVAMQRVRVGAAADIVVDGAQDAAQLALQVHARLTERGA
ncbi:MAG TPA: hypothetical protein VLJ62_29920, partial [Burkholderiaceae bacterium]|nr:hypothetical protein [Burkholderiaceae bacterium]